MNKDNLAIVNSDITKQKTSIKGAFFTLAVVWTKKDGWYLQFIPDDAALIEQYSQFAGDFLGTVTVKKRKILWMHYCTRNADVFNFLVQLQIKPSEIEDILDLLGFTPDCLLTSKYRGCWHDETILTLLKEHTLSHCILSPVLPHNSYYFTRFELFWRTLAADFIASGNKKKALEALTVLSALEEGKPRIPKPKKISIHPPLGKSIEQLAQRAQTAHAKGNLIVHVLETPLPDFCKSLLHLPLAYNRRQLNRLFYPWERNYHTIFSSTLLPSAHKKCGQNLYSNSIFALFAHGKIKFFSETDCSSQIRKNSHGRLSYAPTQLDDISYARCYDLSQSQLDKLLENYARSQKGASRMMNEIGIKANIDTLLGLGYTALALKEDPKLFDNLLNQQSFCLRYLGIQVPLFIYNHHSEPVTVILPNGQTLLLAVNQLWQIPAALLKKKEDYLSARGLYQIDIRRYQKDIAMLLEFFAKNFKHYKQDEIEGLHKHNRYVQHPNLRHRQIRQTKLLSFLLKLNEKAPDDDIMDAPGEINDLIELYNLVFRMRIIRDLIAQQQPVNLLILAEELHLFQYLLVRFNPNIGTIQDRTGWFKSLFKGFKTQWNEYISLGRQCALSGIDAYLLNNYFDDRSRFKECVYELLISGVPEKEIYAVLAEKFPEVRSKSWAKLYPQWCKNCHEALEEITYYKRQINILQEKLTAACESLRAKSEQKEDSAEPTARTRYIQELVRQRNLLLEHGRSYYGKHKQEDEFHLACCLR